MSLDEEVFLDLSEHCIETAARAEYSRLLDKLLEADDDEIDSALGEPLEILKDFIENEDFSALRSGDPELAGKPGTRIRLIRGPDGMVCWEKIDAHSAEG